MIFYFSSTGNSYWVAKRIASIINDRLVNIADCLKNNQYFELERETSVGFVFPVYGWSIPEIIKTFTKSSLKIPKGVYTYIICTCGDDAGYVEKEFQKTGIRLNAAYTIIMPNTYVCLPGFDVDAENIATQKQNNAKQRVVDIAEWIKKKKCSIDIYRGSCAWIKTYILGKFFHRFLITDKKFYTTSDCVGCGICVKNCPIQNIIMNDKHIVWAGKCIGCLSCYHHCPNKAIQYGNYTKTKGQFVNNNE